MSPTPLRLDGIKVAFQRRGTGRRLTLLALGMAVLTVLIAIVGEPGAVGWLIAAFGGACPLLALVAVTLRGARLFLRGSMAIAGDDLVVTGPLGQRRVRLDRLVAGSVSPRRRELALTLADGNVVHARVASVEEGKRLLEAAGVDAKKRTLTMQLGETTFLDLLSLILGMPIAYTLAGSVVSAVIRHAPRELVIVLFFATFLGAMAGIFQLVRRLFGPAEIVVGVDGLVLRQRFTTRFVAHERIRSVVVREQSLEIHLHGDEQMRCKARHFTADEQAALRDRIDEARAAHLAGAAESAALGRLDRRGRPMAAWREALRGLLADAGGYREGVLSRDDLARVVESPAAPVERRIGAAVALSFERSAEERARLRVAAEACANPKLRVALEHATAGEIDAEAVEEAIAAERAAR